MAEQHPDSRPECTYCLSAGHGALTCEFMDGDSSIICVFKYKMKFATLYLLPVNMTGLLTSCSDFITQEPKPLKSLGVIITVRIRKCCR